MKKYSIKIGAMTALCCLAGLNSYGDVANSEEIAMTEAEKVGVDVYTKVFPHVSRAEAKRILSAEMNVEVSNVLSCSKKLDGFAGLEIRHEPKYKIVVKFDKQSLKKLRTCTRNSLFRAVVAPRTDKKLDKIQSTVLAALKENDIRYGFSKSIRRNRLMIDIENQDLNRAKKIIDELDISVRAIRLRAVDSVDLVLTALIQGNQTVETSTNNCTSGWNVMHSSGVKGVTTAGHCGNSSIRVNNNSHTLQLPEADPRAPVVPLTGIDLQWMTKSAHIYPPEMSYTNVLPGTFVSVVAVRNSTTVPQGSFICAIGRSGSSPHERCGYTTGTYTGPIMPSNTVHTFPKANHLWHSNAVDSFVQEGDSGGPIYSFGNGPSGYGALAMGTIVGHLDPAPGIMLYTPPEKFSSIGLTIITN